MKLILAHSSAIPAGACPYRLLDQQGDSITWANDFLDAQHARQLSPRSVRAYAYDLLHFARWFQSRSQTISEISESTLLDYVRHQQSQQPQATPQTVNHRLTVIRCLYRFHTGEEIPGGHSHFQRIYTTRCPLGYGRPHRAVAFGLRLKATSARHPSTHRRTSHSVLGQLSYFPRFCRGGLDVTRWPAFL